MSAAVYRFFTADGSLLYVGCSGNLGQRLDDHASRTPWFSLVQSVSVEHFADRSSAITAEALAISTESPTHNVRHTGLDGASRKRRVTPYVGPFATAGQGIRQARKIKGISIEEFAAEIGVTPGAVSQWETGRYGPRQHMQVAIARVLDVPHSLLFGLDEVA